MVIDVYMVQSTDSKTTNKANPNLRIPNHPQGPLRIAKQILYKDPYQTWTIKGQVPCPHQKSPTTHGKMVT